MKPLLISRRLCAACFLMFLALPASAESEQDQVRDAVLSGKIMPLGEVLQQVEKNFPGKVLEVELEREGDMWVYEIKLLRDSGALSKLYFDARDGAPLKGKPHRERRGDHRDGEDN